MNSHSLTVDEVLTQLDTDKEGLSSTEAGHRLEKEGPNKLPDPEGETLFRRIIKHFNDVLIYVLLVAVVITALLQHWIDSAVILGVVIINAAIGFIQEGKAEAALEGIRKMLSLDAHVLRDGHWVKVDATTLVPGDVVRLRSGDRVPADIRLFATTNLQVEESALTGESLPVTKKPDPVGEDAGIGDRTSMAFSSTLVTSGRGAGVVVGTGIDTEIGRINTMISEVETLATPLTRAMNRFGKQLSLAILVLAVVMFAIGVFVHSDPMADGLLAAISFAVAAIPEGLPAIMTITLAIGVQRMARRNAITRRLTSVETLGSVTVICSDKTGTLTKNEMTVRSVVTADAGYEVTGIGYEPDGQVQLDGAAVGLERGDLAALVEALGVANDAEVDADDDGVWQMVGEPTEGALQTLAVKCGFDSSEYDRRDEVPFESEHKLMAVLADTVDDRSLVLVKGAPDALLERSSSELVDGRIRTLRRHWWEERVDELTRQGLRVLAAARRDAGEDEHSIELDDLDEGLVFLGIVGIVDPPRPEAIEAIADCKRAGITVKMITGDHPSTALAIAKEMGIVDADHADDAVVPGTELENATDEELTVLAQERSVFARTSPEHKLRLVKALQATGEVVAMTGDGVNDAPTLKRADVGVAMGIKGTEATKEAAEIVLADDNFASIARAVEEGRTIYDNLRKAILFILPTNGAEALVILAAVVANFALPLTPTQILWVNMVTAVTLALALGFEKSEPGIMDRPPRDPNASILGGYFLWRITLVSVLLGGATIAVFHMGKEGDPANLELARTVAVNTLVFGEVFYLLNSRFLKAASFYPRRLFSNPVAWASIGVLMVLQAGFVYLPFMNNLFGTTGLSPRHWVIPIAIGLGIFVVVEIEKAVIRWWEVRHPGIRKAASL